MKIGIIGGGIIGLTTGVVLAEAGHDVRVFTREPIDKATSWAAGAVCYPFAVEQSARAMMWLEKTIETLSPLAEVPEAGVLWTHWRKFSEKSVCEAPSWLGRVKAGRVLKAEECPAPYQSGIMAELLLMAVDHYVRYVMNRFEQAGGVYDVADIPAPENLAEQYDVLVNATGVYAKDFVGDDTVNPARGQAVIVKNPGVRHHTALFEQKYYIYPRGEQCLLGGSFDEHAWDRTPDESLTRDILAWAGRMEPLLLKAEILDVRVGLRPLRPKVRLDQEILACGTPLIHNYGHGGAGYTLSWGCAFDVLHMIETL